jgi:hypothetical protein
MSMRIHKFTTYMQAEEAATLIEFIDQLREVLMHAYGEDIRAMMRQTRSPPQPWETFGDEDPF